ncbi:hypothetical protein H0H81_010692 [Sphagnurus paluster]|uniref:G-patch domain-containing protein n=1 Tax=Sphagnurus paluster TaxID=117069 RepID=A0A9P7G0Q4_9AGAR|nr:hypothetical protein H0H81_010692 [Sphagnurus paluster]
MPLDGHSYLVSQGWTGKGTGLRQGAISRPLAIPKKKNLAGLGKDRDEAFPFWDHLFSAAAKSIQLKVTSDDEDSDAGSSAPDFKRTTTGILSNRRPVTGVSATTSGTSTPDEYVPKNLLSRAKREAARKGLYARFFRGPVLGPDDDFPSVQDVLVAAEAPHIDDKESAKDQKEKGDKVGVSGEKRKRDKEDDEERLQRKNERKEQKAKAKEEARTLRRQEKAAEGVGKLNAEDDDKKEKKHKRESKGKEREVEIPMQGDPKKKEKKREKKVKMKVIPVSSGDPSPVVGIEMASPLDDSEPPQPTKRKKRKREVN